MIKLNEASIMYVLIFVLIGCDQGQIVLEPVIEEVLLVEDKEVIDSIDISESDIPEFPTEELVHAAAAKYEEIYLTLPDFREEFLKNNGNVESTLYRVRPYDWNVTDGTRIRIERNDVAGTNLNYGYIHLSHGKLTSQHCHPLQITNHGFLLFYLKSPEYDIQKNGNITIYTFNVEIVASRASRGKKISLALWNIPLTTEEIEENCW